MSAPFVGEIRVVGFNFAPRGWATCDGQIMSIAQNTALFSLLGTNYGGDGRTTFALPNLQDASPLFWGQGPGLSPVSIGEQGGVSAATVSVSQLPSHTHQLNGGAAATTGSPTSMEVLGIADTTIYGTPTNLTPMSNAELSAAGGGAPHNNRQPYQGQMFIIALQGIFPARN